MSEVIILNRNKNIDQYLGVAGHAVGSHAESEIKNLVANALQEASKKLSPIWDIRDYVAVNPFFGFRDQKFIEVARYIKRFSGTGILPKKEFFRRKFQAGEITDYDLKDALKSYRKEREESTGRVTLEALRNFIETKDLIQDISRVKCLSELYDIENQSNITDQITNEVSKWAAAYFDEGQAVWKIPTDNLGFYSWWKSLAKHDKPFGKESDKFTKLLESLPHEPMHALHILSEKLFEHILLKPEELTDYFYRLIFSVMGWAAYVKKFEFEANRSGNFSKLNVIGGLVDIVAIRMAYDMALLSKNLEFTYLVATPDVSDDIDFSYIWLNAAECAYRRSLLPSLRAGLSKKGRDSSSSVQAVFCIDVRSEVMRRHLENLSPHIQTIGFAGFFGAPISIKALGSHESDQNCPVLLNPKFEINEVAIEKEELLQKRKSTYAKSIYFRKAIQSSTNSGFSFMETLGLTYVTKLIGSSLGKKPNVDFSLMGLTSSEKKHLRLDSGSLSLEDKLTLAMGALINMGLTKNFAKYVFFFGHGSESANNPYSSALDCGACAGHNGYGNAAILVQLLNENEVREELRGKGIDIPKITIFVSGWHNTTKDDLVIEDSHDLGDEQKKDFSSIIKIFSKASENCRRERSQRLPSCSGLSREELLMELGNKANDWSEVRPEWGLARNASFIVGRRLLTRGLKLDGRSFLHDYDYRLDHDLSVLELIMTAPMIVTNWINMQYYASTIDPIKFGAGNKVLNNVVSGIGCIQGNESDLLGGLTEQSVLYRGDYFHEPIRLQVFIEADPISISQIIEKHQLVKDLISNSWLRVISINPETEEFKTFHMNSWIDIKEGL